MNKKYETDLNKKEDFTAYYKLDHKFDLVDEMMLLDVSTSEELMIKNKVKGEMRTPFHNASITADKNLDYVEGFILLANEEKELIYECGWNRKRDENVVINVSPIKAKEVLIYPRNYVEVIRFPLEKMIECIIETDGYTPFFLYFDEYQEVLDKALRSMQALFPKAIYFEEAKAKIKKGKKALSKRTMVC